MDINLPREFSGLNRSRSSTDPEVTLGPGDQSNVCNAAFVEPEKFEAFIEK
jgi:hypothetical protein